MPAQNRISLIASCLLQITKSKKPKAYNQCGFSLLEIVLALFLVLSITAVLLTTGGSLFQTRSSKLQSIAARIASKDIENLRKIDSSQLPSSGPFSDPDLAKLPAGSASRTITDYAGNPKVKQVTINISWVDKDVSKNYTTDTLIYQDGL